MGSFTTHTLQAVDETIETHMQILADLCRLNLGSNLDSLVLAGSFGRGEGSVLISEDGSVRPMRDYDVRVILHQPAAPEVVGRIRERFMQATGLGGTAEQFSGETGFSLTLEPLTVGQLGGAFVRDRDLRAYDHVTASRLIWGRDHSANLQFPASEIPQVNGLRFLYQKMVGLVGHVAGPESFDHAAEDNRSTLVYECDKTFVEICTALCLLAGAYVPSYRARADLFSQNYRLLFPDLALLLPDLDKQILRATQEKLRPGSTPSVPPAVNFTRARKALLVTHRYYVRKLYGIDVVPSRAGCRKLAKALSASYFQKAVSGWLSEKHFDNPPARWALNEAYSRALRLKFAHVSGVSGVRTLSTLRHREAPNTAIFLAAWCVLASLRSRDGQITGVSAPSLRCAAGMLAKLPGGIVATEHTSGTEWDKYSAMRAGVVHSYHTWEQG